MMNDEIQAQRARLWVGVYQEIVKQPSILDCSTTALFRADKAVAAFDERFLVEKNQPRSWAPMPPGQPITT